MRQPSFAIWIVAVLQVAGFVLPSVLHSLARSSSRMPFWIERSGGFRVEVVSNGVLAARFLAAAPNDDVIVSKVSVEVRYAK